nr:LLM class flavin-dependent oxidoreductase [Bacillus sp. FJAT-50079]
MAVKSFQNTLLSILDLVPITEGGNATESFKNSVEVAQHAEEWGYNRYWLAEHHNMPGIASSATSVIIGHIAGATKKIRVGSGGIMLPNHAPLVIAEQFGTLESIYPGRIDLGLGRAPGSDRATAYALRRSLVSGGDDFPEQLEELQAYFEGNDRAAVHAYPGEGLQIPIWLLGSSGFSAQLAAFKGLPFSFASHFAPDYTLPALQLYRDNFKPSDSLQKPYAMVGLNVIAADTDEKAQRIATTLQQQFLSLNRGTPMKVQPPVDNMDELWSSFEREAVNRTLDSRSTIIGSPETVKRGLEEFIARTQADELIIRSTAYYQEDRLRSYEIIADLME